MPDNSSRLEHIGTGSHIAGYDVFLSGDTVTVLNDDGVVTRRTMAGLECLRGQRDGPAHRLG